MSADTRFITNEAGQTLRDRFQVLIKDTRLFDVLVGYFYSSGFLALSKSLENTEHIRILIGMGTDQPTVNYVSQSKQLELPCELSHAEAREAFAGNVAHEMETSEDEISVEEGVNRFLEWLKTGKLEIKIYPTRDIHAKLYIMTFKQGDKDDGRVITGSSNFTRAGLSSNIEFNVELKDHADYEFALTKFNLLWLEAVDVKDIYADTIRNRTWLNDTVTPYELYLKLLYEYFRNRINQDQLLVENLYLPDNFRDLEYQREAVIDAKDKLDSYGGVFLSDVVGLGKTYIAARLASQLDGRNLVLAPPNLLDINNPGSWRNVFSDFRVPAEFESIGKLDDLAARGTDKYKNIFIDEAHRFRNENNVTYETLAKICRGKRVILVSATPLNNSPQDILSQINLFQKRKKSNIPNLPNLEHFFNSLKEKLGNLDRAEDYDQYVGVVRENAREVREKVLKYLIVRRTRGEIVKYFGEDLIKQGVRFPEVATPEPIYYQLNPEEENAFDRTVALATKEFQYARYTPLLNLKEDITQPEELAQKNMRKFMKLLLVKRLESSFFAFKLTLERFINSYEQFIEQFNRGKIYVSKKYSTKIYSMLDEQDYDGIQNLVDTDKAREYYAADFKPEYKTLLEKDLTVLKEMRRLWAPILEDPKLDELKKQIAKSSILKKNKLIIFTESRETSEYLGEKLEEAGIKGVLNFSGASDAAKRDLVIANFDARARNISNEYRILVSTEVLSEGVNLHQSNVVINYDIPWNPTRIMQRVGRINRVDTKFDKIYTFTFFPTRQANEQIKLEEAAKYKIQAFIEMLGVDARLLTEGEDVKSHDLFNRLLSKKTITGEDGEGDSELKYLEVIREIRDKDPALFEKIKRLPKKSRSGRHSESSNESLLTYFRKDRIDKFFLAEKEGPAEIDFLSAAKQVEVDKDEPRTEIDRSYYGLLALNKTAFERATSEAEPAIHLQGGRDSSSIILRTLKTKEMMTCQAFTDEDERYLRELIILVEEGGLPRQTAKTLVKELSSEIKPLKIFGILKSRIPEEFFKKTAVEESISRGAPREVILSEYFDATGHE